MTALHALAIFAAGIAAGTINTVVGSGTLITFPVLLAFGYAPVVANVSNTVGLVPGSCSGAVGYRRELDGQWWRLARLAVASVSGAVIGAVLLLSLPASSFTPIVSAFIALALVLILIQRRLAAWMERHRGARRDEPGALSRVAVGLAGVYGGYFGAAQGIMLLAILGLALDETLQRINALKVVLAGLANFVSGLIFVFAAHVDWPAAGLIAAGSIVGGVLGAWQGRRLPAAALRLVIVAVGIAAIVKLLA